MFTLFDLLILLSIVGGAILGGRAGYNYFGTIGAVVGVLTGGRGGLAIGRIPKRLALWAVRRELAAKTSDALRASLRSPDCMTSNLVLLELQRRGEAIRPELPIVLDMLVSEDTSRRGFGWAALTSAFPELAGQVRHYRINDSVDECRRKTEVLRQAGN